MPGAFRPPVATVAAGDVLRRVHHHSRAPIWFGRRDGTWRFDDSDRTYGVAYFGRTTAAALAETLLRDPGQDKVLWSDVASRREALIRAIQPLRLATVHGPGLSYFAIQQSDVVASAYDVPQAISARVHNETPLDGIQYRSRFDSDELCVALFERASPKIELVAGGLSLDRAMVSDFLRVRGKRLAGR